MHIHTCNLFHEQSTYLASGEHRRDETIEMLGEFPIGYKFARHRRMRHLLCVGAVHRSLRPSQALSGSLLASRPPAGTVPTSPGRKSASPAQEL